MRSEVFVCNQCPKMCNIDRKKIRGACRAPYDFVIARSALHHGEEPVISGTNGSGTIFFSGCNMACVFCQNYEISQMEKGKSISAQRMVEIFFELKAQGAHNINLVTPSHYLLQLIPVLEEVQKQGLNIPICYNSSAYEKVESLKQLEGLIQIYLVDLKYYSENFAKKYSRISNYFATASRAVAEMYRQVGVFELQNDLLVKGMIVRHLALPRLFFDSKKILKHIWQSYGEQVILSLMNQYQPLFEAVNYPGINRRLTNFEYDKLVTYAFELGFQNAYIQDEEIEIKNYTPSFDLQGV